MTDQQTLGALFAEYEKTAAITILEGGKHRLEVTGCTVRSKGVCPVYKILEGPQAGKRAMAGGIYPGDTEGGRVAFFRKLEKFGLNKEFFQAEPTLEDVAKALVGRVVIANLGLSEWQGEPRNELGFDIQLESAPPLPAVGGVPVVTSAAPSPGPTAEFTPTPSPTPTATPIESSAAPAPDADPGF